MIKKKEKNLGHVLLAQVQGHILDPVLARQLLPALRLPIPVLTLGPDQGRPLQVAALTEEQKINLLNLEPDHSPNPSQNLLDHVQGQIQDLVLNHALVHGLVQDRVHVPGHTHLQHLGHVHLPDPDHIRSPSLVRGHDQDPFQVLQRRRNSLPKIQMMCRIPRKKYLWKQINLQPQR